MRTHDFLEKSERDSRIKACIDNAEPGSLAREYPNLIYEWDFDKNVLDPGKLKPKSNKNAFWKCCTCKYEWEMVIAHRTAKKQGCPHCAGRVAIPGVDDFASLHPDLLKEWDWIKNADDPTTLREQSNKKVHWICEKCGYEWETKLAKRTVRGDGCPCCSGKVAVKGINDFATVYPELMKDWNQDKNEEDPFTLLPRSRKSVHWKCHKCGQAWEATIYNRTRGIKNCPGCGYKPDVGKKTETGVLLKDAYPELLKDWDKEKNTKDPNKLLAQSNYRAYWKCHKCGYEWQTVVQNRTKGDTGCEHCLGKVPITGEDDLATLYPNLMLDWDKDNNDLDPSMLVPGSNQRAHWRCNECGYEWDAIICDRTVGKNGCPHCAGKVPIKGQDDFATLHPELMIEWDWEKNTVDPSEITEKSSYDAFWICRDCGYGWHIPVSVRVIAGSGCPHDAGKVPIPGKDDLATLHPELMEEWDVNRNWKSPETVREYSAYYAAWECKICGKKWRATVNSRTMKGTGCPNYRNH